MAHSYWTYCMYCGEMLCGVELLDAYPDVVVLYAHKTCYERHTHGKPITPVSGRDQTQEVPPGVSRDAGTGGTEPQL